MNGSSWNLWPNVVWYTRRIFYSFFSNAEIRYFSQNLQKIPKTPRGNGLRKPCTKFSWPEMNGSTSNRWPKVVWYACTRGYFPSLFSKGKNTIFRSKLIISKKIPKTPRGNDVRKPCTKFGWWEMNISRWVIKVKRSLEPGRKSKKLKFTPSINWYLILVRYYAINNQNPQPYLSLFFETYLLLLFYVESINKNKIHWILII